MIAADGTRRETPQALRRVLWAAALLLVAIGAGAAARASSAGLVAMVRAFVAIRRRQIALHREWMIRVFAFAVGISTVRLAAVVIDIVLAPSGLHPTTLFVASLWTGWVLTAGAAEVWIRYTRPRRQLERANEIKHAHHDCAVGKRAAAG